MEVDEGFGIDLKALGSSGLGRGNGPCSSLGGRRAIVGIGIDGGASVGVLTESQIRKYTKKFFSKVALSSVRKEGLPERGGQSDWREREGFFNERGGVESSFFLDAREELIRTERDCHDIELTTIFELAN